MIGTWHARVRMKMLIWQEDSPVDIGPSVCQNPDESFGIEGQYNCRYWVAMFARVQMKMLIWQEDSPVDIGTRVPESGRKSWYCWRTHL